MQQAVLLSLEVAWITVELLQLNLALSILRGGMRSTGSVSVSGGSLELTSNEPSIIAGTGLTVTSGATVFISSGSVAFEAELVGDINADAPVTFLDSVGGCPSNLMTCETVAASSPPNLEAPMTTLQLQALSLVELCSTCRNRDCALLFMSKWPKTWPLNRNAKTDKQIRRRMISAK